MIHNNENQAKGYSRELNSKTRTPLLSRNVSAVTTQRKEDPTMYKQESILPEDEQKEKPSRITLSKTNMLILTKFLVLQSLLAKREKENDNRESRSMLDSQIGSLKQLAMDEKKLAQLKQAVLQQGMEDLEKGCINRNCKIQDHSISQEALQKREKGLEA